MHVIGTAGHVDHGKSSLVQALTGIDPDRLKEEIEREMTIDLGFAWMTFEDGREEIGIVDVPGHRDFIENMLAGVGGIDLALLVIAADEGVMPQTAEHLAILDLLQIKGGVIALSKIDLVEEQDWLELVILDISETVADTVLAEAPIISVSAHTGEGIEELRSALIRELAAIPETIDLFRPRLPVDRVFSLPGFGTVVTGTLLEGQLSIGDVVEIQPQSLTGRIRGLQTHKTKKEIAEPGSRVAVNISGVNKREIRRGDVLTYPEMLSGTILCDVEYEHLASAGHPLEHNQEVKFFSGAAEVVARTRVIGAKQIHPGESGWLQLVLKEPVAIMRSDRYILRRPSPATMLGGGSVLDPYPGRRYRRFSLDSVSHMETLARGKPSELLMETLSRREPIEKEVILFENAGIDPKVRMSTYQELLSRKEIVQVGRELFTAAGYRRKRKQVITIVTDYHQEYPLRKGIQKEELRNRTKLTSSTFSSMMRNLEEEDLVQITNNAVNLPVHTIQFTGDQESAVRELMIRFDKAGINSPSVKDAKSSVGEEVYYALLELDRLVQVSPDVVYEYSQYNDIKKQLIVYLKAQGQINVAQVRDLFETSRKYAIALLEHFDDLNVTRRVGDERQLVA